MRYTSELQANNKIIIEEIASDECYYVCKDYNINDAIDEIKRLSTLEGDYATLEGCPACIVREQVARTKTRTYMAMTPSGSFIEFYLVGNTVYEIISEEGERPVIIVTAYRLEKLEERLEELRMQALITEGDLKELLKWKTLTN